MFNFFRNRIKYYSRELLTDNSDQIKILVSRLLIENNLENKKIKDIKTVEFKVFSQFGDDGIIQYLIHSLNLPPNLQNFIEFGVSDYWESNTRFLLVNNNWRGLILDCSKESIDYIQNDKIYWMHDLTARCEFVDKDNVNKIFIREGFSGDIGLLSLDIDGNDYWVWEKINAVSPIILILEYNSVFGIDNAISIPYQRDFYRTKAHPSNLYWGASLKALYELSKAKGYTFLGCNSAGNNSYFIRNDYAKYFSKVSLKEGYVESKYRESRDASGKLTYLTGRDRLNVIKNMFVTDVTKNKKVKLSELA